MQKQLQAFDLRYIACVAWQVSRETREIFSNASPVIISEGLERLKVNISAVYLPLSFRYSQGSIFCLFVLLPSETFQLKPRCHEIRKCVLGDD